MNKKRILTAILSLVLCVCAVFSLTACNEEHTHDYGTTYKSNATQHWKQCQCGDKIELDDHVFDAGTIIPSASETEVDKIKYTCSCGYEKTEDYVPQQSKVVELFDALSNVDLTDGVNITVDGDAFADKMEIYYYTQPEHQGETKVVVDVTAKADVELYFGMDENGKLVVNGAGFINVEGIDENSAKFLTLDAEAYVVIENDIVYVQADVDGVFCGLSPALQEIEGNFVKEGVDFCASIDELIEMIPADVTGMIAMVSGLIEQNGDFIKDELIPLLDRVWGDVDDTIEKMIEINLESMFSVKENGDTQEIVYDFEKIKATADNLYNLTMAEFMDEVLGEGAFAKFKGDILGLLDLTLNEIVYYIFTTDGLTIKELEDKINEIGKQFNPEFDLAKMLNIEGSIADFVETDQIESMLSMTLGELAVMLMMPAEPEVSTMAMELPDVTEQVEELKVMLAMYLDQAGQMTFYQAIVFLMQYEGVDLEAVKLMADQIFDIAGEVFGFKIVFDAEGNFEKMVLVYDLQRENLEKISSLFPVEQTGVEIAGGGNVITTVTVGDFANALEVDYGAIVESFTQVA